VVSSDKEVTPMEFLQAVLGISFVIAAFVGLDVAALRFGVDSRDQIADTHRR
jgi:hypothetical protein